jgi:hypothetical protein
MTFENFNTGKNLNTKKLEYKYNRLSCIIYYME